MPNPAATVQLERIPPRKILVPGSLDGTSAAGSGVEPPVGTPGPSDSELSPRLDAAGRPASRTGESEWVAPEVELPRGRIARVRAWALLVLACVALLGQGERFRQDARFRSPGATLETYWGALRDNDLTTVTECFTEPQASLPFPGMLWFLPPVDSLRVASVHVVSAKVNDVVAMYEVRFTPAGSALGQHFVTTSELRRIGREWRIVPPTGEAAMPEWKPYPRPVDS